jgi:two-component system, cell cycle sensor histidine kinase and response regulator CckA
MREVSGKSAAFVRDACLRLGLDYRGMTAGLEGLDGIDEPKSRIDWAVFAELLERFAQKGGGLSALEEVGTHTADAPFAESIRVIAGAFASSRTLYRAIVRWFAPGAVRSISLGYEDLPGGQVRIVVQMKPPHAPSLPFFHMTAGSYRAAPRILGQADAVVDMRIDGDRAIYRISPPPDLTLLSRGRRGLKVLVGARRAIEELARQQDELKESYEALLASRRDFRLVIDSVPTDVLIHREGRILYANPHCSATLGFDPTGRIVADLVAPHARERIGELLVPSPSSGSGPARVEIPFVRAGGGTALLELAPSQPVLFDGEAAAVLVGHDVTERRELEVKSQLADRMASIGTIAAGVAHEINNPLTYVIDNVRRLGTELESDGQGTSREELRQLVVEAVSGIERVELIVRDLHMFSRAERDTVGPVDVREVIESTARIAAKEVRSRAQLVLDLNAVPPAAGQPTRLGQVILNLVLNAAHAIPEGFPEKNRIDVTTRVRDGSIVIEVKDTGSGIRPENLARVFEPFFTTKPIGRGTGLGLAVCHQIVTAMGGKIAIESQLGSGTTVRVTLPIAEVVAPAPSEPTALSPAAGAPGRKRILVVDDEPLVARALRRALRAHDVTIAIGGREALAALRETPFDIIVCDLMMPGVSGMDLYEQLPLDVQRRFVFATGGAFNQRAQQFLAEVPNQRIDKPFNADVVARVIGAFDHPPRRAR